MRKVARARFNISCTYGISHAPRACIGSANYVPRACKKLGRSCLFLLPFWVKPTLLAQTQVETLTINTDLPHSKFLVQNCGSSRGRQLWSFKRVFIFSLSFYLLLDFLGNFGTF